MQHKGSQIWRLAIIQRDHRNICHTNYSHFHDFPRPRPDSRTFQAWKMWLKFQKFPGSVRTLFILLVEWQQGHPACKNPAWGIPQGFSFGGLWWNRHNVISTNIGRLHKNQQPSTSLSECKSTVCIIKKVQDFFQTGCPSWYPTNTVKTKHTHTLTLHFNSHFSRWTWVSRLPP